MQLTLHQAGTGGAEAIAQFATSKDNPIVSSMSVLKVVDGAAPQTSLILAKRLLGLLRALSEVEDSRRVPLGQHFGAQPL
jgi:hypothetical protein